MDFLRTTALCSAIAMAGPAFADLTADELWADWQEGTSYLGTPITAGETKRQGKDLQLLNVVWGTDVSPATSTISLESVTLSEQGDGTVRITLGSPIRTIARSATPDAPETETQATADWKGLNALASGKPGDITYDVTSDTLIYDITSQTGRDAAATKTTITVDAPVMQYAVRKSDDHRNSSFAVTAPSASLSSQTQGNADVGMNMTGTMEKIDVRGTGNLAAVGDGGFLGMTQNGSTFEGRYSIGPSVYDLSFRDEKGGFDANVTSAEGTLDVALGENGISYQGTAQQTAIIASGPSIPLPQVAAKIGTYGFKIAMPIAASEEPRDMALRLELSQLDLDPSIWGMLDPSGALPHDPATLLIDMAGKANWLVNIFDPEVAAVVDQTDIPPGEIQELTLNELRLNAIGTDVTGSGAFTFDNTDLETFGGFPAPDGALDLTIVGANQLLDNLTAMGLLPADKAMGARMMLGLFAKPGDGEDTMVSNIEVNPDGSILANGTRIK